MTIQPVSTSPTIRRYRIHWSLCQHPCYCSQVSQFLRSRSLASIFLPSLYDSNSSMPSAWRTFASSLSDVFSFLLRCFRFLKLVFVFNLVNVYLQFNRITPNRSQTNNADQKSSNIRTGNSLENSLCWQHMRRKVVNQEVIFYFRLKSHFSADI